MLDFQPGGERVVDRTPDGVVAAAGGLDDRVAGLVDVVDVVAGSAVEFVTASAAVEDVVAGAAPQCVVAAPSVQDVVAAFAGQDVRLAVSGEGIGGDPVVVAGAGTAQVDDAGEREFEGESGIRAPACGQIGVAARDDGVGTAPAVHRLSVGDVENLVRRGAEPIDKLITGAEFLEPCKHERIGVARAGDGLAEQVDRCTLALLLVHRDDEPEEILAEAAVELPVDAPDDIVAAARVDDHAIAAADRFAQVGALNDPVVRKTERLDVPERRPEVPRAFDENLTARYAQREEAVRICDEAEVQDIVAGTAVDEIEVSERPAAGIQLDEIVAAAGIDAVGAEPAMGGVAAAAADQDIVALAAIHTRAAGASQYDVGAVATAQGLIGDLRIGAGLDLDRIACVLAAEDSAIERDDDSDAIDDRIEGPLGVRIVERLHVLERLEMVPQRIVEVLVHRGVVFGRIGIGIGDHPEAAVEKVETLVEGLLDRVPHHLRIVERLLDVFQSAPGPEPQHGGRYAIPDRTREILEAGKRVSVVGETVAVGRPREDSRQQIGRELPWNDEIVRNGDRGPDPRRRMVVLVMIDIDGGGLVVERLAVGRQNDRLFEIDVPGRRQQGRVAVVVTPRYLDVADEKFGVRITGASLRPGIRDLVI